MANSLLMSFRAGINWLSQVIVKSADRFWWDDCFSRASALAYSTLFALVPLSWLVFSMFAAFGFQEAEVGDTVNDVLDQILPKIEVSEEKQEEEAKDVELEATENLQVDTEEGLLEETPAVEQPLVDGENIITSEEELEKAARKGASEQLLLFRSQIINYFTAFHQNVKALSTLKVVTIGFLVFVVVALLNTIESALNVIWRVTSTRSVVSKITNFSAVMVLGPLCLFFSFFLSRNLFTVASSYSSLSHFLTVVFPMILSWFALFLLYYMLPSVTVRIRDAAFGALIAALLFEIAKRGFAYYVKLSTFYGTVYGVLAAIPLFLFWLYLAWLVVLYGAEVAYQSGSIKVLSGLRKYVTELGEIGSLLALRILLVIGKNFCEGKKPPSESEIAIETGSNPVHVRTCLDVLSDSFIISASDEKNHTRALVVSPEKLTLGDILDTFRSKEHRLSFAKEKNSPEINSDEILLEKIRKLAHKVGSNKPVREWALVDLVDID